MEKTYLDYDVADNAVEAEKNISRQENNNYKQVAFDVKNYLNVKLEKNEKQKTIYIRLLPFPDTRTPFLHIHMHRIMVPKEISESGFRSFVCLEKTEGLDEEKYGKKCPFCELSKASYKEAKTEPDADKKQILRDRGKENLSTEYVIMRCIERGKEDEGVKFWKTAVHQAKDDPYNQICILAENRKNEWLASPANAGKDPKEANILSINDYGYDLMITISKKSEMDKNGKVREKTSYMVSDVKYPSPLSPDPEQAKAWVFDEKKWFDVFVPKPYDYMALVMQGKLPWYDRTVGKWVSREDKDAKEKEEVKKAEEKIKEAEKISTGALAPSATEKAAPASVQKQLTEEPEGVYGGAPEDDLPF